MMEFLVAVVVFSLVAAAVASSVTNAQRAAVSNERLMRAVFASADALEQARLGQSVGAPSDRELFRNLAVSAVNGSNGLQRAEVTVRWYDHVDRSLTLSTLIFRPTPADSK